MRMLSKIFYFLQLMPKSNKHNLVQKQVKETTKTKEKSIIHNTTPPTHNSNFQPGSLQSYPKETKFEVTDCDDRRKVVVVVVLYEMFPSKALNMFRFVLDDKKLTSSLKEKKTTTTQTNISFKNTLCVCDVKVF